MAPVTAFFRDSQPTCVGGRLVEGAQKRLWELGREPYQMAPYKCIDLISWIHSFESLTYKTHHMQVIVPIASKRA